MHDADSNEEDDGHVLIAIVLRRDHQILRFVQALLQDLVDEDTDVGRADGGVRPRWLKSVSDAASVDITPIVVVLECDDDLLH